MDELEIYGIIAFIVGIIGIIVYLLTDFYILNPGLYVLLIVIGIGWFFTWLNL